MRRFSPPLTLPSADAVRAARNLSNIAIAIALACAASAASARAAPDPAHADGAMGACAVLVSVYDTLERSELPASERLRLADTIVDACARSQIRLLRATTLGGVAVLEPSAGAFAPGATGE